jgi:hypothetical protein
VHCCIIGRVAVGSRNDGGNKPQFIGALGGIVVMTAQCWLCGVQLRLGDFRESALTTIFTWRCLRSERPH